MDLDHTFRMLMVVGFFLLFPIGLFYRLKSQASGERLDRSQEGVFMLATLRPVGLIYWAGMVAYMIDPAWMAWSSMPLPAWVRWTGTALAPLGAGLLVWTFRALGPNLTDTVVTRQSHTLVTRGPYRFVRHPFYDSAAVLAVATSMMMANWFVLVTGALVFLLLALRFTNRGGQADRTVWSAISGVPDPDRPLLAKADTRTAVAESTSTLSMTDGVEAHAPQRPWRRAARLGEWIS